MVPGWHPAECSRPPAQRFRTLSDAGTGEKNVKRRLEEHNEIGSQTRVTPDTMHILNVQHRSMH